jgi:cellulose synthase/poly-beta-1,6-N-acetylglucosamine synthase-like glycosyltransferase
VRGTPFEVVVVPPGFPRTKPRALAYALPLARGTFVTVFDAEDRPHPLQLRQAWAAFRNGPPDLGCVQAALVIDNQDESWLAHLFAIEYAALFDGLLPALAAWRIPVPLGGTSNHFRRRVLNEIGGWDCHNVTEDADVGIRLARFGYRTEIIHLPTLEEAPTGARTWLRQRTRWFKGWLQTTLVHTRHPLRLVRELGVAGTVGFLLMSAGMVISAMVYPFYVVTVLLALRHPLALWQEGGAMHAAAFGVYLFNLVGGPLAMGVLSRCALRRRGRKGLAGGIWLLPAYWLFMSAAAYCAVAELALWPHYWAKTPHRRYRAHRRAGGARAVNRGVAGHAQALPVAGG